LQRRSGLPSDATAAISAVASLLIYPLAWFQYDTCLLPVIAWVIARIAVTEKRSALWILVAYVLLRAIPDVMPTPNGEGIVDLLARYKNWIQVIARGLLFAAVIVVTPKYNLRENHES
jgi:hypothetical protein